MTEKKSSFIHKVISFLKVVFGVTIFVVIVPVIFYYCYLWGHRILEGAMLGGDTAYHLAWMKALDRFYPKMPLWFPFAGMGSSIILGYWVFSYYLAIIGSHLSSFSISQMVRLLEFVSVPIVCLEIYLFLWIRKKNIIMATLGALLFPLSSLAWGWVTNAGFFSMQLSTIVYLPTFMFFDLYLESELVNSENKSRKRLFLLGYAIFMALGFLIHGSFMPNLYLGLPLYAVIRSQLLPRRKEKRLTSLLRSIKVLTVTIVLGFLAGAYFFLPQRQYFALQPFISTYGAADTPTLPWRAFLGFERLTAEVGSLYVPLFLSLLVTIFGLIGTFLALIKRNFLAALGIVAFFYVCWLSSARYLATNFPFLQLPLLPTATRVSSLTGIYLTIMAAYGLWSVADLPGVVIRWVGNQLKKVGKAGRWLDFGFGKLAFIVSTALVVILSVWAFNDFRSRQVYSLEENEHGILREYRGYGMLTVDVENLAVPLCKVPGWENEVAKGRNCQDYMPKWVIGEDSPDSWPQDFTEAVKVLNLGKFDRVSVSPFLGPVVFSFARHSEASMVSTPGGPTAINLGWMGIHDRILFLEGEETSKESAQIAKWFGTKYVFLKEKDHKKIFPEDAWPLRVQSSGIAIREFNESSGLATLSTKPAVLVIGSQDDDAYSLVFQTVIKGGFSFDQALLVEGSNRIDDYSLEELRKFEVIVLQGYSYRRQSKAWSLLRDYVDSGGSLYLETGWQYVNKDWGRGPDKSGNFSPAEFSEPSPVSKTQWENIGGDFGTAVLETEFGKDLNLANFGSLSWGDSNWGIAMAERDNLQSWAEPVLMINNKVVMARGSFGQGRVFWSGMNFLSHVFDKENKEEYRLLGNVFQYLLRPKDVKEGKVLMDWDSPDRIEFTLSQVPKEPVFLYFAETFTPNWRAYLEKNGERDRLKIFRAGPGFKAVRLTGLVGGEKVIFEYSPKKVLLVSFGITFITFLVLMVLIFDAWLFNQSLEKKLKSRLFGKHLNAQIGLRRSLKEKIVGAVRWDEE
ncbi:hypothetical protein ACFL0Y_02940 [Patescibacteria group bacterium]